MIFIIPANSLVAQSMDSLMVDPFRPDRSEPPEISGMQLVWHDEFEQDGTPASDKWGYEHGFVRNRELQWYQPQNVYCSNGLLIIEARKEEVENPDYREQGQDWKKIRQKADYTSSCVITEGLQEWPGPGHYEIRARFDPTVGAWPAIWLLGTNNGWPSCGEIDILEFYRIKEKPVLLANAAWGSEIRFVAEWDKNVTKLKKFLRVDPQWVNKFHLYSMDWDDRAIELKIDGQLMNEILLETTINPDGSNPFDSDNTYYLLLNLAVGANGGQPDEPFFPFRFEVDYVRVYEGLR